MSNTNTTLPAEEIVSEPRVADIIRQCEENASLPNPFWKDVACALRELQRHRENEHNYYWGVDDDE